MITDLRVLGGVELLILCDNTMEQIYENGLLFDKDLPQRSLSPGSCYSSWSMFSSKTSPSSVSELQPSASSLGLRVWVESWTKDQVT